MSINLYCHHQYSPDSLYCHEISDRKKLPQDARQISGIAYGSGQLTLLDMNLKNTYKRPDVLK